MKRWRDAKRAAEAEGRPPPPIIRYNALYSRRIHGKRYHRVDIGRERAGVCYSTVRQGREEAVIKDEKIRKTMKSLDKNLCKGSLRPMPVGVRFSDP